MRIDSTLRVCGAAVLCLFVALSCDRDNPATVDETTAPLVAVRPSPTISISTVEEFEDAWDDGNFANNTVFLIESGSVLVFASDQTFGVAGEIDPSDDKSFSLVGDDTTAVLKKTNPTTPLFSVSDTGNPDTGLHTILIDNIKIEATGSGGQFANFSGYGTISVTDAVVDLQTHTFQVQCDNLLIDGSHIRARSPTGLNQLSRMNHAFDHTIRNSTLVRKHNGVGTAQGPCRVNFTIAPSGSLTWENNQVIATAASDGTEFCNVRVILVDTPVDFVFEDNDFGMQTLTFDGSCADATVELALANNNSDLVFCGDGIGVGELIECENCDDPGDDFDLEVTLTGWSFEGDPLDYDDFGPISGQNACYDATDIVYVEFALATTADFEDYQDVEVEWGDDNCTTGGGTVQAEWNASTSKWNASFDVSGVPDADVYWRGKGTLCSKTVVGECIRRRFTLCGAGGVPVWFTQE